MDRLPDPFDILDHDRTIEPIGLSDLFDISRGRRWAGKRLREVARDVQQRKTDYRDGDRYQQCDDQTFCAIGQQRRSPGPPATSFPAVEVIPRDFVPI